MAKRLILVAEDEIISQRLAASVIEKSGYKAQVVSNGQECLDALIAGVQPDLILLDLAMPVMNGIELLQSLKQQGVTELVPIVVFTAHNEEETVMEAVRLGADDFIVKPYQPHELGQRIGNLIFDVDEAKLRAILAKLHFQDHKLAEQVSLRTQAGPNMDFYPIKEIQQNTLVVSMPTGVSPQVLSKMSMNDIMLRTMVFRKCIIGWRKVWPRHYIVEVLRSSS